ncbi:isoamylase early set domain-containing protein [Marinomonas sp. C2222]|uniref:Isoamylase early set domain-containing protein n=1 Tax=Marinomonas sargassi TaxID=2984494 RepID=A0ABT2YVL6_9GAMM|nr:isoamylase early set domain-containing protein [Marinomonas sargassi]MCV2403952.1 isoamylase early set domain-containing protein [Marinomonas sargassi]
MIEKTYLKTKPECKVKFSLSADTLAGAKKVFVVGDFNDWDTSSHPLRKQKSGAFSTSINFAVESSYQFRYLVDGNWLNDDMADGYAQSPMSGDSNCVLNT